MPEALCTSASSSQLPDIEETVEETRGGIYQVVLSTVVVIPTCEFRHAPTEGNFI